MSVQGPIFKLALIIFTLSGPTGLALLFWLANIPGQPTPQQETLSTVADWLTKGGFGALFGILVDRGVQHTPVGSISSPSPAATPTQAPAPVADPVQAPAVDPDPVAQDTVPQPGPEEKDKE